MKLKEILCLLKATLCLIQITHTQDWHFEGVNIALGKYAEHSPNVSYYPGAEKAVDGNTANDYNEGSCTHTKAYHYGVAYWKVHLNGYFVVKGVKIYNRNVQQARLKDFQVIGGSFDVIYNDSKAQDKLYYHDVIGIQVTSSTPYSEITIFLPDRRNIGGGYSTLTLCEVEVFAVTHGCIGIEGGVSKWHIREGTGHYNYTYGLISENSVLDFTCNDPGYRPSYTADITCMPDGNYSASFPTCREIVCPKPMEVHNGDYLNTPKEKYKLNDIIRLQCRTGYKPIELQARECLETSSWNDTEPICTLITCPFPETFTNGTLVHMNGGMFEFGVLQSGIILNIVCNEGFISEDNTTWCTLNGNWSIVPACQLVKCESLMDPPRGIYTYSHKPVDDGGMFVYGTEARVTCFHSVYVMGGENSTLFCDQEGIWIGNKTICGEKIQPQEQDQTPSFVPGAIGGGVAGVVLIAFAFLIAAYVFLRKRRRDDSKCAATNDKSRNTAKHPPPEYCYENATHVVSDGENKDILSATTEQYYNCNEIRRTPISAIQLADLPDFVNSLESSKDKLKNQFKSLPCGLIKPCNSALEAKGKNRYRNLYAWIQSSKNVYRIPGREIHVSTDFDRKHSYPCRKYFTKGILLIPGLSFCLQGPTKDILSDFWRMVWQIKSNKIIMLTNLKEHGKMKSEKYWPDNDPQIHGLLTITMVRSETFKNFVIRTLSMTKDGEEQRTVTQFHFTSWPDQDVPLFCSSLIHFHHKVKDEIKPDEEPIIIHCSAGIGRTGTFIALDYLYDQAKDLGYIDVLGCVKSLRQQRVNMVQTMSQYVFIHIAIAETVSLKTSCVSTAAFEDQYKQLLKKDEENKDRNIDNEFKLLEKLSVPIEDDTTPEQKENAPKVDNYMPSLSQPGLYLYGEYIDAAFLPIYREDNALIIARTPTGKTMEDFWNLIYHQTIHTVVMMDEMTALHDKQIYWPRNDKEEITIGKITIVNEHILTKKKYHTIVSLKAVKDGGDIPVSLIHFGGWNTGKSTPDNTDSILSALELVEENQRNYGNSPVLVHCMDGVEKSGLFCVMVSVLDRLKIEQDVAISQVIQEIRSRRPNVIPNVDQFQFCHEVVLNFLQDNETYANFSIRK